jgi:geranylgeranyl pyrophosphate synthase
MGADQQAGFMGSDPTRLAYSMRYLVTKGKQIRPLRLALWIELTEMFRHRGEALLQS